MLDFVRQSEMKKAQAWHIAVPEKPIDIHRQHRLAILDYNNIIRTKNKTVKFFIE